MGQQQHVRSHQEKRLHEGGVGPGLLTLAGLEPNQKETPLSGRRASDTIVGGVNRILAMPAPSVKRKRRARLPGRM